MVWPFKKGEKNVIQKAQEANEVLTALGIESHTESGKQIRSALAMEILGESFDLMDKHSKASFMKQHGGVMGQVRQMLIEEGVLSNPGIEQKGNKK